MSLNFTPLVKSDLTCSNSCIPLFVTLHLQGFVDLGLYMVLKELITSELAKKILKWFLLFASVVLGTHRWDRAMEVHKICKWRWCKCNSHKVRKVHRLFEKLRLRRNVTYLLRSTSRVWRWAPFVFLKNLDVGRDGRDQRQKLRREEKTS